LVQPAAHGLGAALAAAASTPGGDQAARRALVLAAKVLQGIANGAAFGGKEAYMGPFNAFVEASGPAVADYLDGFAVRPHSCVCVCVCVCARLGPA
jgi:hypothetical protein